MIAITFDPLKFTRTLKDSGLPEAQAEAIALAFRDAQGESEFTTKADHRDLDTRFTGEVKLLRSEMHGTEVRLANAIREVETRLSGEMKLLRWMMGATFGGVVFILLRLLIPVVH
jgi:hypothetical protein